MYALTAVRPTPTHAHKSIQESRWVNMADRDAITMLPQRAVSDHSAQQPALALATASHQPRTLIDHATPALLFLPATPYNIRASNPSRTRRTPPLDTSTNVDEHPPLLQRTPHAPPKGPTSRYFPVLGGRPPSQPSKTTRIATGRYNPAVHYTYYSSFPFRFV